jgi:hypothetical protein
MFNVLVKLNAEQKAFLGSVKTAMEQYFGSDQRRIEHALQVSLYAEDTVGCLPA